MLEAASELDLGPAVSVAESLSPQSRRRFEEALAAQQLARQSHRCRRVIPNSHWS